MTTSDQFEEEKQFTYENLINAKLPKRVSFSDALEEQLTYERDSHEELTLQQLIEYILQDHDTKPTECYKYFVRYKEEEYELEPYVFGYGLE